MKKIKYYLIILFLLIIYIIFCATSYTHAVCTNISNSIFRLHVIANSDSTEDQNLKYLVRDNVLEYFNEITKDITSKEEIINIANNHLEEIENIAKRTVYQNGYDYNVKVEIGNYSFPTKSYGDIIFPPGYYDAIRIEIGKAKGQNWWCVMFPPLCFIDTTSGIVPDESKEIIESSLTEEEYSLISEDTTSIKFKFKIVEVLQNLNISGIFM